MVDTDSIGAQLRGLCDAMAAGDPNASAALFHEQFFSLDPTDVVLVEREQLRAALPRRAELFGSIGATGTRLRDLTVTTLDDRHVVAHTTWDVLFNDAAAAPMLLESAYLLRKVDGSWQVLVYLNLHDVIGALEARR
jgi:hypothetical protein